MKATATDLSQWASRRTAQDQLPRIVRNLIYSTVNRTEIKQISFPSDESVQMGGWDGLLSVGSGNEYVPDGVSVWEFGASDSPKTKADKDYVKRTDDPLGLECAETTFIFVTPRIWGNKQGWIDQRKAEGKWKDVRVFDADDLAQWLETSPSNNIRFLAEIGRCPYGLKDFARKWEEWAECTVPAISTELVVGGRNAERDSVLQRLLGEPTIFAISAETQQEAIAFLLAAVQSLPKEESEALFSKGIIVHDAAHWDMLKASISPLILVPLYSDNQGIILAVKSGHHVVVPVAHGTVQDRDCIELHRLRRQNAEEALKSIGLPEQKANRYAALARRSLTALRRRLAPAGEINRPLWAEPEHARAIIPALLLGAWNNSHEGDQKIVSRLAGKSYAEAVNEFARWNRQEDAPIRLIGNQWMLVSQEDAWELLYRHLTPDDFTRFRDICIEVLTAADPRLDLPEEQRSFASVIGVNSPFSDQICKGIAETLALFGSREAKLPDGRDSKEWARAIVYQLFDTGKNDEKWWEAISDLLPTLAQAAPEEFLGAVSNSLRCDTPVIAKLFKPKENFLFGSSPHTGLLWALETLAWSTDYLSGAADALARLSLLDPTPDSNHVNRPHNSLIDIFLSWMPHTAASLQQRLRVIDRLRRTVPDVAWQLMCRILPNQHSHSSVPHGLQWRDWVPDPLPKVTHSELVHTCDEIIGRLIADLGHYGKRWCELLDALSNFSLERFEEFMSFLTSVNISNFSHDDRMLIWDALRSILDHHREFADADWAMNEELLAPLEIAYLHFTPEALTDQYAHLFTHHVKLVNPPPARDYEGQRREAKRMQIDAITQLLASGGIAAIIEFADQVEQSGILGGLLGEENVISEADEPKIFELLAEPVKRGTFAQCFVIGSFGQKGWHWADKLLSEPFTQNWSPQQRAYFYCNLPCEAITWDRMEKEAEDVRKSYWESCRIPYRISDTAECERAINQLMLYNRCLDALDLAEAAKSNDIALSPDLIISILEATVRTSLPENANTTMLDYHVTELLDTLSASGQVDEDRIAMIEWMYQPALRHGRGTQRLHKFIARNPSLFVELLSFVYRAKDEEPRELNEKEKHIADRAMSVLRDRFVVPGVAEDGTLDVAALRSWVDTVKKETAAIGREDIANIYIGHMLAFSPSEPDGAWPLIGVRDLIEDLADEDIDQGIQTQVYNNRGVVSKSLLEGGVQENTLAETYRKHAQAAADMWPRVAAILRRIAESYAAESRHSDMRAVLEEDLWQ